MPQARAVAAGRREGGSRGKHGAARPPAARTIPRTKAHNAVHAAHSAAHRPRDR